MGITCRCSVKGIIGPRHEVIDLLVQQHVIVKFNKYSLAHKVSNLVVLPVYIIKDEHDFNKRFVLGFFFGLKV